MVIDPLDSDFVVPLRVPRLAQKLRDLRVLVQLSSWARANLTAVHVCRIGVTRHISLHHVASDDHFASGDAEGG